MKKEERTELFRTRNGAISYSEIHEDYNIQFSNMMIKLEPQGFLAFREFIHEVDINYNPNMCSHRRCFVLKMPSHINFVFSKNEILELRYLVDTTCGMQEILALAHDCLHIK